MAAALSTNPVLLVRPRRDAANQRGRSQAHGFQTVDTTPPACNGCVLTIACKCGVIFERWITPQDVALDLVRLANRRRSPAQYDERGWRATFYNERDGVLADKRNRHRLGADAVARDAAGVRGVETSDGGSQTGTA